MAQGKETETDEAEPEYITYLLDPKVAHDTYFIVGNNKTKIGAVKKMLIAHSVVLRSELQDSELAEKGDIELVDISPDTFKNLLRYVYGYNNISNLSFDEADDLLYAADRYLIKSLKDQLALRLMTLLNSQNVCSLLNNPACHTVLELDAKITEILQYETDLVFSSPEFINIRIEGLRKILDQNDLVVSEIEIWRAALKWAKHQGGLGGRSDLRVYFSHLKHIRIRTIEFEDMCKEIMPSEVLTNEEVVKICIAHGRGETIPFIKGFSEKTYPRFQLNHEEFIIPVKHNTGSVPIHGNKSSITIKPINDIILLPFEFQANTVFHQASTEYQCEGTIEVTHVSDPYLTAMPTYHMIPHESHINYQKRIKFNNKVKCGQVFKVPLDETLNRRFLSNNSYTITIEFTEPHKQYGYSKQMHSCKDFQLVCNPPSTNSNNGGYNVYSNYLYISPFKSLKYIKCPTK